MVDIETLQIIVAVAEEKSIALAAKRLNVPKDVVDDFCRNFEQQTNCRIIEGAFANRFVSTQGMELYNKAKEVLYDLGLFDKWMYDLHPEPAGDITIVTTPFMGSYWVMPKLKVFMEKHPRVDVKLVLKYPPIQAAEGDVVITAPEIIRPKGFNSWEVVSLCYGLYASPAYLEKYGAPLTASDLDHHRLIAFRSGYEASLGYYDWSLTAGLKRGKKPRKPNLEVDSPTGIFNAVKLGMGIGELPDLDVVIQCPDLVRILPDLESGETRLNYIFEKQREKSPLVGELYNHLRSYVVAPSKKLEESVPV